MCGSKGTTTTTQQQSGTTRANPAAMQAYQALLPQVQELASPTTMPTVPRLQVAPVNAQQQAGIANINAAAGQAQPYIQQGVAATNQALGYAQGVNAAGQPISTADIMRYYNPNVQNVVDTTEKQFAKMNAMQQQQVLGNAAALGALGGDRVGIAQAVLAGEQAAQEDPIIAQLYSQAYQQAVQTGLSEQQAQMQAAASAGNLALGAGYGLGNLGVAGQNAALQGAGAQVGAGTLEQQTQQANNQAAFNQAVQQFGLPYALTMFGVGAETGLGSAMGSSYTQQGTSQTTPPPPNFLNAALGAGLMAGSFLLPGSSALAGPMLTSGAGLFGGSKVKHGGRIEGFQFGGAPSLGYQIGGVGGYNYSPTLSGETMLQDLAPSPVMGGSVPPAIGGGIPGASMAGLAATPLKAPPGFGQMSFPGVGQQPQSSAQQMMKDAAGIAGLFKQNTKPKDAIYASPDALFYQQMDYSPPVNPYGDPIWNTPEGVIAGQSDRRGGRVPIAGAFGLGGSTIRGFDDGGDVAFDTTTRPQFTFGQYVDPVKVDVSGSVNAFDPIHFDPDAKSGTPAPELDAPREVPESRVAGVVPSGGPMPIVAQDDSENAVQPRAGVGAPEALPPAAGERRGLSDAARIGLMAAGLGMMASRSPYFGVALGEGGLQGLQTYSQERMQELKLPQIEAQTQKLQAEAAKFLREEAFAREHGGLSPTEYETARYHTGELQKPVAVRQDVDDYGRVHSIFGVRQPDGSFVDPVTGKPISPPGSPASVPSPATPGAAPVRVASIDGSIPAHNALVASGPFDYSKGAPPNIDKGYELPQPANISSSYSADAIRNGAEYYLQTGKMPAIAKGVGRNLVAQAQNRDYQYAVINYANALAASRGMSPEDITDMWRSAPLMGRFVMGPDGRATVALGTAVRHLDTLQQLQRAWYEGSSTGNWQTWNHLQAFVGREFGNASVTNLDAASKIIGTEIIKALGVAGAGSEGERANAASAFGAHQTPEQAAGAVRTVQALLAGQLEGKEGLARAAGVPDAKFKQMVGERPYAILDAMRKGSVPSTTAAPPAPSSPTLPTIHSKAEYDALPSGQSFLGTDGKQYRKP